MVWVFSLRCTWDFICKSMLMDFRGVCLRDEQHEMRPWERGPMIGPVALYEERSNLSECLWLFSPSALMWEDAGAKLWTCSLQNHALSTPLLFINRVSACCRYNRWIKSHCVHSTGKWVNRTMKNPTVGPSVSPSRSWNMEEKYFLEIPLKFPLQFTGRNLWVLKPASN